jgi:type IV secretory pathway TraG/TraD family ATPase VirD4
MSNTTEVYTFHLGLPVPPELEEFESTWNPLRECDQEEDDFLEKIGLIADACIVNSPGSEPHWADSAKTFWAGVCMHVRVCAMYAGERTIIQAYDLVACGFDEEEDDNE